MPVSEDVLRKVEIVSPQEVIARLSLQPGSYACFVGAGASAEAKVPMAGEICQNIFDRKKLFAATQDLDEWRRRTLNWDDPERRYSTCLSQYGPPEARVEYFRSMLSGKSPAFCHHAIALLMGRAVLKPTCLTTNFDKLIEIAFAQQGQYECQPVRIEAEARFWRDVPGRYHIIKLHGDYDTHNIANTRKETTSIEPYLGEIAKQALEDAGLIVFGSAGNEISVHRLFEDLQKARTAGRRVLSLGIYWSVYAGSAPPATLTDDDIRQAVYKGLRAGDVNPQIVETMVRANSEDSPFAFFPIWGTGNFLFAAVKATGTRDMVATSARYLDHEMRLRHVFSGKLTPSAVETHIGKLRDQRRKIEESKTPDPDYVWTARNETQNLEVQVLYGDITDRSIMGRDDFAAKRRAVVSPEDTCISAGGGAAYALLRKAGASMILNELAKLGPIGHREVAVTSGGNLPVHYILHSAALNIEQNAEYRVCEADVTKTIEAALAAAEALQVTVLLIPLLAAGVAALKEEESFRAILQAIKSAKPSRPTTILLFVLMEKMLSRQEIRNLLEQNLGPDFHVGSTVLSQAAGQN